MAHLFVHVISTDRLTYIKESKRFVAEASDFRENLFSRVYDDAADCGFVLRNPKTGAQLLVVNSDTEQQDGETLSWTFSAHCSENPEHLRDITVVVFND